MSSFPNPSQFTFNTNVNGIDPSFLIILVIMGFLLWLGTLILFLRRTDMKLPDRVVWVVILCTLNFLGAVLYWFLAPANPNISDLGDAPPLAKDPDDFFNTRG